MPEPSESDWSRGFCFEGALPQPRRYVHEKHPRLQPLRETGPAKLSSPPTSKVAIVAALEREVNGLIRGWSRVEREYVGRKFVFFEQD